MRRFFMQYSTLLYIWVKGQTVKCSSVAAGTEFVPDRPADAVEQLRQITENYLLFKGRLHMYSAANSCCGPLEYRRL